MEFHNVTEGRYVCANGGNCTSPGVCECAAGWSGFDCRTPICSQVDCGQLVLLEPFDLSYEAGECLHEQRNHASNKWSEIKHRPDVGGLAHSASTG